MKTLLLLVPFCITVCAQSQAVPCGSTPASAAAAPASPSGRTTSAAALAAKPPGEPGAGPAAAQVAAQIRERPPLAQLSVSCRCGTVSANSLTAVGNSQEILMLPALAGAFRFEHVLLQETERFAPGGGVQLSVGAGRPGGGTEVVSPFALMSPYANNFWYARPTPPQLTGAYDLVLNFQASSPLGDGATSRFTAGTLAWEVCGYYAPPRPAR